MRKISLLLSALVISACSQQAPMPSKMPITPPTLDKTSQKGNAVEYHCKNDLVVRVVQTRATKQKNKLNSINLTFNNVTQKLQPSISENGKNYANIRWIWQQRNDFSTLKTSVGVILAEECVLNK